MKHVDQPYRLSAEARWLTCIHEAAHAVLAALGGSAVYRLAVAPLGAIEWANECRKGPHVLTGLWGVCQPSDARALYTLIDWDDDAGGYRLNNESARYIRAIGPSLVRLAARAEICLLLAGPAAEAIHMGAQPSLYDDFSFDRGSDLVKAEGLALLLYWRHEYDFLVTVVEGMLRRPDVWAMVLRLADELERRGEMDEFDGLLPLAIDRGHWPPSCRSKAAANASTFSLQVKALV